MTRVEIQTLITNNIQMCLFGHEIEHGKLEFKREWYNLKDDKGIAAFLKDVCAIANTVGPDGYLVIGFDTKNKKFNPVKFSDCGLRDSADLPGIIVKHVDSSFVIDFFPLEVDGQVLNVIHIPPSLDKPHVIRNHKSWPGGNLREEIHRIFVRKGSTVREATKYDIELMYYDRKNIIPEYQFHGTIDYRNGVFMAHAETAPNSQLVKTLTWNFPFILENTGRRTVLVNSVKFSMMNTLDPDFPPTMDFFSTLSLKNFALKQHEIQEITIHNISRSIQGFPITTTEKFLQRLKTNLPFLTTKVTVETSNKIDIPVII